MRFRLLALLCLLPSLASAQIVIPDPILSSRSAVEWWNLPAGVTAERVSPVIRPAPWWLTGLAVAGPLADGLSTYYAMQQSGPVAKVVENNRFFHHVFGSNVRPGEILAFKLGQAVIMGYGVHAGYRNDKEKAIGIALMQAVMGGWYAARNLDNAARARQLNRQGDQK